MTSPLHFQFLGGWEVTHHDQTLKFATRKTTALLAYLVAEGGLHSRDKLTALLWPDSEARQAQQGFRTTLVRLRERLQLALGDDRVPLLVERERVGFDFSLPYTLDLQIVSQALIVSASAAALVAAAQVIHGPFMEGFSLPDAPEFEGWIIGQSALWQPRANQIFDRLSQQQLASEHIDSALETVIRWLGQDSLNEEAHRRLMRLHFLNGDRAAALQAYEACRRLLAEEMHLPPEPATEAVVTHIRTTVPPVRMPTSGAPGVAAATSQAMTTAQPNAHNLPREMTPFFGRETELEGICRDLLERTYPLMTLVAEGGAGKTRLALAVAHQLLNPVTSALPAFPDGIWFVGLAALKQTDLDIRAAMAIAIGKALGFTFLGIRPVEQQLLSLLQHRRCLLILDNFEQLLLSEPAVVGREQPNAVDFVIELLERAPQLQLLVTSRIPLDLNSEFVVRLKGLPVPMVDFPGDVMSYPSVRLFVERVGRVTEQFEFDRQSGAISDICRFVAGLPLGIELAAAWSGTLTPIEIMRGLQANLDFLATHRRDVPARQRSMRVVFDYSWGLLSATTQHVLAQIACFNSSFSAEAATMVVSATLNSENAQQRELTATLKILMDQALLQQDETGRYMLHTLLHDYVSEKLVALSAAHEAIDQVAQKHSRYYLDLVGQAYAKRWYTRAELVPIQVDLSNVQQAWRWAVSHGDWIGLNMGWIGLWRFYANSALFQEGKEAFRLAVAAVQYTVSSQPDILILVAQLEIAHASFLNAVGGYREAVMLAQRAVQLAEAVQDEPLIARGYLAWGTGLYRQSQNTSALISLTQGLTAAQTAKLTLVEADFHKRIANTYQGMADFSHARSHYEQALAIYRRYTDRPNEGEVLNGLGWCHQQQNQLAEALTYLLDAQQIHQAIGNVHGCGMVLINLATVYEMLGDYNQAIDCRQRVFRLLEQYDDPYQAALVNHGLAVLLTRLGDYAAAEPYYLRSLEIDRAMGDLGGIAWTQNNLGLLYNHRGDYAAALAMHQEALQTSIDLAAPTTQGLSWARLGQDYHGLGETEAAYDAYLEAIATQTKLGQQVWLIESKSGLAATQLALYMDNEALKLVEEILEFLATQSLQGARDPMLVYWNCYQVLEANADPRAGQILATANQILADQAARLIDLRLRHTYLENVKTHQALRREYERIKLGQTPSSRQIRAQT